MKEKICIVGMGYIGLPTAAVLCKEGYEVHGVDISQEVVDTINRGEIHIVEPDLDVAIKSAVEAGLLHASREPIAADVYMIAVPTPFHDGFVPNIDYVLSATEAIAPYITEGNLVILESTSPIGTTEKMEDVLKEVGVSTEKVSIAHCPERVLPGHIMRELIENDRIVGGTSDPATKAVADFYRKFVGGEVLETNARTAEMAKLTENSYRDANIAFANELSILCDKFEIDVWNLIDLANRHPRVNILKPGPGVGGHCIAVDPWFIVHKGGADAKLIRTAREVNTRKMEWTISGIVVAAKEFERENGRVPKIACMGLAFKPDIDDLRESPSFAIAKSLESGGHEVLFVEPNLERHVDVELSTVEDAITQADIIVYLVAHKEFKDMKLDEKIVLDYCGTNQ